jgi:hypothetical protein
MREVTMKTGRGRRTRACLWIGGVVLLLGAGAARAAEEAGADSGGVVPRGPSYSIEATTSYHYVNHAYFGADRAITSDPERKNYTWGEGFTRVRWNYGLPQGAWLSVGGVAMATVSTDYFGADGVGDGRLDQLLIGASRIGGSGLSVVAGRQDLEVGDGFLIGDGYRDSKAALWNIPLNFYDALRADWQQGPWHALAFGARLSPSYVIDEPDPADPENLLTLRPKGLQYGGETGWSGSERNSLALGYFQRADHGDTRLDARAVSLRGGLGAGRFSLAGEWVIEGGRFGDADLRGRGGHLGATIKLADRMEPHAQVEYFLFSGDDPATPRVDEGFYPWNYRWTDWSRYYVADLVASTLVTNNDARIWKLECGVTPLENTGLRLLLHRIDLDTGASYGGLPGGVGRGFADEADVVVDQGMGDRWSAWVMGGYVRPRAAARALVGTAASGQIFMSLTYKFEGPGGGSAD